MEQKNADGSVSPAGWPRALAPREVSSSALNPPTSSRAPPDRATRWKRRPEDVEGGTRAPKATDPQSRQTSSSSSHAPSSSHRQRGMASADSSPSPGIHQGSRAASASASSRATGHGQPQLASTPSRTSLPISALVTPRAPSVAPSAGGTSYHMRDPRKPPRVQPTRWGLTLGASSPPHAWLFFAGFVLFPLWWIAGLCVPVPRTRRIGGDGDIEKGTEQVVLDDPQMEFDARTWRKRCRIAAGLSLITYVPFIALLAVFLSRN
ncbi:hypothetical protein GGX14DRAFT_474075 [Mycena pura]|uniref:Uncharacterized protein n=1 Tax=Mycena pura TaxID=153505 RepID=A0AAD6Y2J8_9AGAR|nr:hypothetical protein GGX14DRAFT_474075 [Mycena pura]